MTVFLGTRSSPIKEVKPPFVFDVEQRIYLLGMPGNRASSHASRKPHGFSRVEAETWGIFSSYDGEDPSKLVFIQ